jgi:hypothetical protein
MMFTRLLLALITLIFILLAVGCEDIEPAPRPQEFTFAVYAIERAGEVNASVRWGVNAIENNIRVRSGGFASAYMAYDKDLFFIQVDSADPLRLVIINNKTRARLEVIIESGEIYQFKTI